MYTYGCIHKDTYIEATSLEKVFLSFLNTKYQTYKIAQHQFKFPLVLLEFQKNNVIALQEADTSYNQTCSLEHPFLCHSKNLMLKIFLLGGIGALDPDMDGVFFCLCSQG